MTDWYSKIQKMHEGIVADTMISVKKRLLPLPSPSLNWALGGGLAFGKIATIFGPESSGKSLVAQLAIAELHKNYPDAWAVWYDAEFSFDKDYAAKLGIDLKRLWLIQSNKPSDIFDHIYDKLWPLVQGNSDIRDPQTGWRTDPNSFPCRIIVIDSIKSIKGPKESAAESVENHIMGDLSQLLNRALRKIVEPIRTEAILTICVQQVNEEMDAMKQMMKIKWHVPCGQALKHFSDYMILVEKVEAKKSKLFDETHKNIQKMPIQVGHTVRAKIDKCRTACPHLVGEFQLKYGVGVVNQAEEVAALAIELGLVTRPTAVTYEFQNKKAQGFDKFVQLVESQPELYRALIQAINSFDVFSLGVAESDKNEADYE